MLPRITVNKTVNTHRDASTSNPILEGVYPVSTDLCRPNKHGHSVSHALHMSSELKSVGPNVEPTGAAARFIA